MDNSFGSSSAVDWKICHGYNEPPLIAALEQSALYHPGTHHVVTQPGGLQTEPFDFTGPANGWSTTVTRPGEHTVNTPPYQHTGQSKEFFWRPTKSATSSLGSEPDEDVKAAQSTPVAPPTDLGSQINMASASQGSGSSSNDSDSSPSQSVKRGEKCHESANECVQPHYNQKWNSGAARRRKKEQEVAVHLDLLQLPLSKKEEGAAKTLPIRSIPDKSARDAPSLLPGVGDADVEHKLIKFFRENTSKAMSMRASHANPFCAVLLPMAIKHEGLMHTVLWMAAYHKNQMKEEKPCPELTALAYDHHAAAKRDMLQTCQNANSGMSLTDHQLAFLILYFKMLMLSDATEDQDRKFLRTSIASILKRHRFAIAAFQDFANEFALYHGTLDAVTTMSGPPSPIRGETIEWSSFVAIPECGLQSGYLGGINHYINEIVRIRNIIRPRWDNHELYAVTEEVVEDSMRIGNDLIQRLQQWENVPQQRISSLYACYAYLFLIRTVRESYPSPELSWAVDLALSHLESALDYDGVIGITLPIVFMIGCAAFKPQSHSDSNGLQMIHVAQRDRVRRVFARLRQHRKLPDTDRAYRVVERVWEKMDSTRDEEVIGSWHWEEIMAEMGIEGPFA